MCMHVYPVDSKLLTALLLVLAAVQPARGAHLLNFGKLQEMVKDREA